MPDPTQETAPVPRYVRDRRAWADDPDIQLNPASLIGSHFHKLEDDEMVWQGIVVAEPAAGLYLLSIDQVAPHARRVQRLIDVNAMAVDTPEVEWRFYDTEDAAKDAFIEWESHRRDRV